MRPRAAGGGWGGTVPPPCPPLAGPREPIRAEQVHPTPGSPLARARTSCLCCWARLSGGSSPGRAEMGFAIPMSPLRRKSLPRGRVRRPGGGWAGIVPSPCPPLAGRPSPPRRPAHRTPAFPASGPDWSATFSSLPYPPWASVLVLQVKRQGASPPVSHNRRADALPLQPRSCHPGTGWLLVLQETNAGSASGGRASCAGQRSEAGEEARRRQREGQRPGALPGLPVHSGLSFLRCFIGLHGVLRRPFLSPLPLIPHLVPSLILYTPQGSAPLTCPTVRCAAARSIRPSRRPKGVQARPTGLLSIP